jgi:hypothetical protein
MIGKVPGVEKVESVKRNCRSHGWIDAIVGVGPWNDVNGGVGVAQHDGFTSYKSQVSDPPRTRWGDFGSAVVDGNSIWIASEYIAHTCVYTDWGGPFFAGGSGDNLLGNLRWPYPWTGRARRGRQLADTDQQADAVALASKTDDGTVPRLRDGPVHGLSLLCVVAACYSSLRFPSGRPDTRFFICTIRRSSSCR